MNFNRPISDFTSGRTGNDLQLSSAGVRDDVNHLIYTGFSLSKITVTNFELFNGNTAFSAIPSGYIIPDLDKNYSPDGSSRIPLTLSTLTVDYSSANRSAYFNFSDLVFEDRTVTIGNTVHNYIWPMSVKTLVGTNYGDTVEIRAGQVDFAASGVAFTFIAGHGNDTMRVGTFNSTPRTIGYTGGDDTIISTGGALRLLMPTGITRSDISYSFSDGNSTDYNIDGISVSVAGMGGISISN